jgi:hypothetical protein
MANQCRIDALADGADRLEQVIRGVKDRQYSEARTAPEPKTVTSAFAVSPEEAWSKKFMTAGIGPTDFKPVQMPSIAIAAPTAAQALRPAPTELEPAMAPAAPLAPAKPEKARTAHIGQALAKPARRRSWLGRLVRG